MVLLVVTVQNSLQIQTYAMIPRVCCNMLVHMCSIFMLIIKLWGYYWTDNCWVLINKYSNKYFKIVWGLTQ